MKLSSKLIVAALAAIFIAGCAGLKPGKYGTIRPDGSVEQSFMAGKMKPELAYYYLASETSPYVIIGVDRTLVLDNKRQWRVLEPQLSTHLQRVVQSMYDTWRAQGYTLRGFRMLDQDGRYIGDWYSIWDVNIINPVLYSKDQNSVVIYPPSFPRLEPSPPGRINRR